MSQTPNEFARFQVWKAFGDVCIQIAWSDRFRCCPLLHIILHAWHRSICNVRCASFVFSPSGKKSSVVILKFLVTNHEAGSIIGSSGRTIKEVQEKTGASVKLSTPRELFPGTEKRVAKLTGGRMEVERAMSYLLDKMASDAANWHETLNELDIVVPNNTAGLIIGKGGETIKKIQQDTGVRLKVSDKKDQDLHKLSERLVLLNGDLDRLKDVVKQLLDMIETDPMSGSVPTVTYNSSGPVTVAHTSSHHGPNGDLPSSRSHRHASSSGPALSTTAFDSHQAMPAASLGSALGQPVSTWPGIPPPTAVIDLPVPAMLLNRLLNHQPSAIPQIESYSLASLHIGDSGGLKHRTISISGTLSAAETAVFLLRQKLQQQSEANNL